MWTIQESSDIRDQAAAMDPHDHWMCDIVAIGDDLMTVVGSCTLYANNRMAPP